MKRLVILGAVLTLAACGGGDGDATQYRADANAICLTATSAAEQVPAPADSAEAVASYAAAARAIREQEARDLAAVEPPSDLAEEHEALVSASGGIVRSLLDLEAAAKRGDKQAAAAASTAGASAAAKARTAASKLGLDQCGRPGRPR